MSSCKMAPLDFINKMFSKHHLGQSTYENEMLAIMHNVDLWHPYLLGKLFEIKIDHQSLKYFLEKIISSPEKQKWVTKIFGYDYEIIYKKGKENVVVDSVYMKYKEDGSLFPYLSLSQIGFKRFTRNGYKIPNFQNRSNHYKRIHKILQGTHGTMESFIIKVSYI
jgi:hypothetical protein